MKIHVGEFLREESEVYLRLVPNNTGGATLIAQKPGDFEIVLFSFSPSGKIFKHKTHGRSGFNEDISGYVNLYEGL